MPLEINEIGISMRVTSHRDDGGGHRGEHEDPDEEREELIEECIRRVFQAMKIERER